MSTATSRATELAPRLILVQLRQHLLLLFVASVVVLAGFVASPMAAAVTDSTAGGPSSNTWLPTGPLLSARAGQTATLLPSGRVLIAGGDTAKAELYDPSSGTFTTTGSMSTVREEATATLLPDGDVLVAGGSHGNAQLNSAELYNPSRGTWALTAAMNVARSGQTATLLADGDVLVAGGGCNGQAYGCNAGSFLSNLKSAELYDPTTATWSLTGSMSEGRQYFTATLLRDGTVLVAGGFNNCDDDFCSDLASAELYDPATGKWTGAGSFHGPREQQTATLLEDGDVLMAGGLNEGGDGAGRSYLDAELYDPSAGTWAATGSLPAPHYGQTATMLPNGWVLLAGGQSAAADVYEPSSGIWVPTGTMSTPRTDHTATLLSDGRVLVTGGAGPDGQAQSTAELYVTGNGPLVTISPTSLGFGAQQVGTVGPAQSYTVANNGSGNLLVSGVAISGVNPGDFTAGSGCHSAIRPGGHCAVYVRFAPTSIGLRSATVAVVDNAPLSPQAVPVSGYGAGPNAWAPTGSMATARQDFTATRLSDGDVLMAGGEEGVENYLATAELYDPTTGTFIPTGALNQARAYATATLLPDGEVLVAGGLGTGPVDLSSAELYDPTTGTWSPTGAMNLAGYNLSSVLLPNGNVLVEGFVTGVGAELYNPTTGTWTNTGPLGTTGYFDTATLLANGKVLAAGGDGTAAALYDPNTNDWAPTGPMVAAQGAPTATLLSTGQVLVAGGEGPDGDPQATSELYDPTKGTWALTLEPMNVARFGQSTTLLTDGEVLVTGGCTTECDARKITASTEVYDPSGGDWFNGEPMVQARFGHTATLLGGGNVLVAGGSNYCCQTYASAEIYTPTLVSANPSSGTVGQQVVLSGSGYFAHEMVKITWDGGVTRLASARTSNRGTFSAVIAVPGTSAGEHQIDAEGAKSFANAGVAFDVTKSP